MSARAYLFSLEQIGIKLGLEQIRALLAALDHPERDYPSIVVAGTNGKGSVTAMVERALRAAGYRTGRYTSPHLVNIEERFAIDGEPISPATFDALAEQIQTAAAALPSPPSFFEATTALALEAFRDAEVDVAVLEVGLGGRLDATNAVASTAVAITAIDFDHEAYLGDTLEKIAGEKAGVIKPGGLVVLGENTEVVRRVVADAANAAGARLVYAGKDLGTYANVRLGLRGRHQIANAAVAIRLLEELGAAGTFTIPEAAIRSGLEDVVWPGRLEAVQWQGHDVLIDGAHNPAGARALAEYLRVEFARPVPIVIGVMKDKHVPEILAALAPVASSFICTAASSPRATTPDALAAEASRVAPDVPVHVAAHPMEGVALAATLGTPIVVAGSLYLAGEIRAKVS